ncbi:N-acetylmuramoyl-L-alanine amidase [Clostridium sp. YIM B02551]|uniref:N-acetylmuramoyl-L-alanine amidase n=1 Tax=Clostridium sp. YIM B02551 TaxID=2910679 RepID=UPI001EEC6B1A|nr:N-acetylmuramoyl-L-alanine amidase [Clostridium sp. YIM B02551]
MSKIAYRGGHNFLAVGASALIDETTEDRKVKDAVGKYLRLGGAETLDVTPGDCDVNTDLAYGVDKANNWGAEYFISIHFNKAYANYIGSIGTETWIYGTGGDAEPMAIRITNELASLGFNNRGVKTSTGLYELRKTKMSAIIVEVCFVEATDDVALYKQIGYDEIGLKIAEAILNKTIQVTTPVTQAKEVKDMGNIVVYGALADLDAANIIADKLNCPTIYALRPYDYSKYKNVVCVGANPSNGWTSYKTRLVQGINREDTLNLSKSFKL